MAESEVVCLKGEESILQAELSLEQFIRILGEKFNINENILLKEVSRVKQLVPTILSTIPVPRELKELQLSDYSYFKYTVQVQVMQKIWALPIESDIACGLGLSIEEVKEEKVVTGFINILTDAMLLDPAIIDIMPLCVGKLKVQPLLKDLNIEQPNTPSYLEPSLEGMEVLSLGKGELSSGAIESPVKVLMKSSLLLQEEEEIEVDPKNRTVC